MKSHRRLSIIISLIFVLTVASSHLKAQNGCNPNPTPFTDLDSASSAFCQAIVEAYFSTITNGTTATTFSPQALVDRQQMAAFTTRTLDQSLRRGSNRAALNQWWTTNNANSFGATSVETRPLLVQSDGADLWVTNELSGSVSRVRASDGKQLGIWTDAFDLQAPLIALSRVFVAASSHPGKLYMIDPSQAPGMVTTVANNLGDGPKGVAFDGTRIWTANFGSVSIITPGGPTPWASVTASSGLGPLRGMLFDGTNIWVTDIGDNTLKKLDANGAVIQTVSVGNLPSFPTFDGTNIWVPNYNSNSITVVRASTGAVVATLTGNSLNGPLAAAFDGQRALVTNNGGAGVTLWKAADFSPLGSFSTGAGTLPRGACSDGVSFWIAIDLGPSVNGKLLRF